MMTGNSTKSELFGPPAIRCDRRTTGGLTLIEVLATVFVLGMGLIMVAAAFPVGIDQMRRTKDDTQAAELARTALNMIRAEFFAQSATSAGAAGFSGRGLGLSLPTTMADMSLAAGSSLSTANYTTLVGTAICDLSATTSSTWAPDLVSNPNTLAYGTGGLYQNANVIISGSITDNSLVCIPVLMRMASPPAAAGGNIRVEGAGVPLYRVTLVVVKYTGQISDLGRSMPLFVKGYAVGTAGSNSINLPMSGTTNVMPQAASGHNPIAESINVDDGVLITYGAPTTSDIRTGYVYRVVENHYDPSTLSGTQLLDDNPGISGSVDCIVFFNFVAAYYAYIGG